MSHGAMHEMRRRSPTLSLALIMLLGFNVMARPAHGASLRLGVGGSYWLTEQGLFDMTLAIDTPVAHSLSVGGRFGAALTTTPARPAVPLDLLLRLTLAGQRAYLEAVGGPWIFFEGGAVRGHVGLGFGLQSSGVILGLEIGWLDPRALVGLKIAFPL